MSRLLTLTSDGLAALGRLSMFVSAVIRATAKYRLPVPETLFEAYRVGIRALPILLIISFFVGTNLALQGYNAFVPLGGQSLMGMFVALAGVRELCPLMVAAMIAAKAGTEMASQMAVMRIREQIDALEVMAIDPYWYLVTPRVFGIVLVLPALTMISITTLMMSAYLVTVYQLGESGGTFLTLAAQTLTGTDLIVALVKGGAFGILIAFISCYCGFHSDPGPKGVGRSTNAAVVASAVGCAILNYFISELVYG